MSLTEWSLLIVLSILWGGSFFFAEIALTKITPLTIVALRVSIAAIVIWLIVLAMGYALPRSKSVWLAFLCMGVINNAIPFTLIVWGQAEISSSLASILNAATPIFTVIVAGALLKDEPVTPGKLIGCGLGLVGVAILVGPSAMTGLTTNLLAQLAVLGAALSYAIAAVYGRRFTTFGVKPIVTAAGQLLASSFVMVPLALVFDRPLNPASAGTAVWAAILALAVLSTALAYVIYFRILEKAGATNILLVTLLVPVTAILLGSHLLGEQLHAMHLAGVAVIGLGLSAIDGRLWQFMRRGPD